MGAAPERPARDEKPKYKKRDRRMPVCVRLSRFALAERVSRGNTQKGCVAALPKSDIVFAFQAARSAISLGVSRVSLRSNNTRHTINQVVCKYAFSITDYIYARLRF